MFVENMSKETIKSIVGNHQYKNAFMQGKKT